jgi:hypothetical protein
MWSYIQNLNASEIFLAGEFFLGLYICDDRPELPKEEGQEAAQEGGEVLEGMYAPGCVSSEQALEPNQWGSASAVSEEG